MALMKWKWSERRRNRKKSAAKIINMKAKNKGGGCVKSEENENMAIETAKTAQSAEENAGNMKTAEKMKEEEAAESPRSRNVKAAKAWKWREAHQWQCCKLWRKSNMLLKCTCEAWKQLNLCNGGEEIYHLENEMKKMAWKRNEIQSRREEKWKKCSLWI